MINESNAFKITSDEIEMINTKTSSLPSLSLTQNDDRNNSRNANNSENIELLSTTDNAKPDKEIEKLTTVAQIIDLESNKIQSTKPSLKAIEDVANHTPAPDLIESLNVRKGTQSTASIEMITTNKTCKFILFIISQTRFKLKLKNLSSLSKSKFSLGYFQIALYSFISSCTLFFDVDQHRIQIVKLC